MKKGLIKNKKITTNKVEEIVTIINEASDEIPIQKFLGANNELLLSLCPNSPDVWVFDRPKLGSQYIPDFLICHRNSTGYNWILVEIESPTKKPQNKNGRPSSKLTEAISQIADWRIWIRDNISYCRNELGFKGIDAEAEGIVIIGRRFQLDTKYIKQYNQLSRDRNRIMTYGHDAIREHFAKSDKQCFVQLPVGCGKTGLMGLTPFGLAEGRVLIITPNLTIRENCRRELDISDAECFYHKRKVLSQPYKGPFISELKPGANIHDCDNAHIVVSNIQQFSGASKKWYNKLDKNYFRMILIDENHHNVAASWQDLCSYFNEAIVIGFTATPFRADGKDVIGEKVYTFGYGRSMMMGYISPIDCVYVTPASLTFTIEGKEKNLTLPEVLDMRQENWFSKGIALSEECNRHIVQASIKQLNETKKYGPVRQIIAAACSKTCGFNS